jgi:hypothetical protein
MGSQLVPRLLAGHTKVHDTGHSCASMVKIAHWALIFFVAIQPIRQRRVGCRGTDRLGNRGGGDRFGAVVMTEN